MSTNVNVDLADFHHAVLLAFDASQPSSVKEQAVAYCDAVKQSPNVIEICLTKLHELFSAAGSRDEVKFWCLSTLHDAMLQSYNSISEERRNYVRTGLMVLVRDHLSHRAEPNFIKNKLCTVLIIFVKFDYPERWSSFFRDFIAMLQTGSTEIIELFLRLLRTLDEEVVVHDDRRESSEILHNTAIKDSLRENEMHVLVDAMRWIYTTYAQSKPALAALCLDALAEYVGWIDISYSTQPEMLQMLYSALLNPATQLQACHCLCEILDKRMDSSKKVVMVRSMGVLAAINSLQLQDSNKKFCRRVAQLLAVAGDQLLAAARDLRKQVKSDPSVTAILHEAYALIEDALQLAYRLFALQQWKVSRELVDLLNSYIHLHKQAPPASYPQHCQSMFSLIITAIEYPSWYNFDVRDDAEDTFDTYRSLFVKLFLNLSKTAPEGMIVQLTCQRMQQTLQTPNSSVPSIEAVLKLYYTVGEAIPKSMTAQAQTTQPLASMFDLLLNIDLNAINHSSINVKYFECVNRYHHALDTRLPAIVPVLSSFLDQRGIRNSNSTVAGRAAYLLYRTISAFSDSSKASVRPVVDNLLSSIQQVIQPVLAIPSHLLAATSQQNGHATNGIHCSNTITADECNFLCEAMGYCIVSNVVGSENVVRYATAVFNFFQQQLESGLRAYEHCKADAASSATELEQLDQSLAALIESYSTFTKPIDREAALNPLWKQSVELMIRILRTTANKASAQLQQTPTNKLVVEKIVIFLHRMIQALNTELLPILPDVLLQLLQQAEPSTIVQYLQLVGQLLATYKQQAATVLDTVYVPTSQRVYHFLQQYDFVNEAVVAAHSTEKQERLNIYKAFYVFIRTALMSDLGSVLISSQHQSYLPTVLTTVVQGFTTPADPTMHKICFVIMRLFIQLWHQQPNGQQLLADPYYKQLVLHDVTVQSFQCILAPTFAMQNATFDSALKELAELQWTTYKLYTQPYSANMQLFLQTQLQLPNELIHKYVSALQSGSSSLAVRDVLRAIIAHRKQTTKA